MKEDVNTAVVHGNVLEAIAHNVCSLHGFDPAFVAEQERFAKAIITEYLRAAPLPGGLGRDRDIVEGVRARCERESKTEATDALRHLRAEEAKSLAALLGSRPSSPVVPSEQAAGAVVGWISAADRPKTRGDLWLATDAEGRLYPGVFVNHRIPADAALVQRVVLPGEAPTPASVSPGTEGE